MNCRPGDLAVVIYAEHSCNIGRIVQVIGRHDGKGPLTLKNKAGFVWLVRSARRMKWTLDSRIYRRKKGPVPDSYLRPIRGPSTGTCRKESDRLVELV